MRHAADLEIAVCCRPDGTITRVLRNEIKLSSIRTGLPFAAISTADDRWSIDEFLCRIAEHGAAVDRRIQVSSGERCVPLFFYGCNAGSGIAVIGSSSSLSTFQLCDQFMGMACNKRTRIRNRSSGSSSNPSETEPPPSRKSDLTHLQNEVELAKRKLIEKTISFEKNEAERFQEFGMAVHGLRNPASSILSASEYLMEDAANVLSEEQMMLLRGIELSGSFLLRTIENLLNLSEFECGRLDVKVAHADLVSLVKEVILLNQPQASRRGVRFETRFESPELIMSIDAGKITQVIDNLVGNAIKFSPSGGTISLETCASESFVSISIRDQGPGIPDEYMETLFNPFQRGRDGDRLGASGNGLGLAVSKRLIDMHSGTINVHRPAANGSVFIIKLPRTVDAHKKAEPYRFETRPKRAAASTHGY